MPDDAEPRQDGLFRAEVRGDDIDPVIIVDGELDVSGTELFPACVSAVLERRPTSIAIDAQSLSFMDSSGLTSMLIARAAAEDAGVPFCITQPSPAVRRMVERTGLEYRLLDQ